jgi:linoleoyl-CoA desaturase
MTVTWTIAKDFRQLSRYSAEGYYEKRGISYNKGLTQIVVSKALYFFMIWAVPMMVLPVAWWQVLIGWVAMQMVTGFVLAAIFQPAHVVPEVDYPLPDPESSTLENDWATNQILTTANFAQHNKAFSWLVGGLNHQVEHHLFPDICHVHYSKISPIVKETATEFGLPYHSNPTFIGALQAHTRMLYKLGR